MKRPAKQLIAELQELRQENQRLLYWLLRSYIAMRRSGWERGPTEDEIAMALNHILANHGLCGHRDCGEPSKAAGERLLKRYDKKEWVRL